MSAKFDAVKTVNFELDEIVDLLENMSADTNETLENADVPSLLHNIVNIQLPYAYFAFWYDLVN